MRNTEKKLLTDFWLGNPFPTAIWNKELKFIDVILEHDEFVKDLKKKKIINEDNSCVDQEQFLRLMCAGIILKADGKKWDAKERKYFLNCLLTLFTYVESTVFYHFVPTLNGLFHDIEVKYKKIRLMEEKYEEEKYKKDKEKKLKKEKLKATNK